MFTAHNAAAAYQDISRNSSIEDASPHKLVEMLFSGAIDRISQAKGFIERGEIKSKGVAIGKALSIVEELRRTLDMEKGGEVAVNLQDLYIYIKERLVTANLKSDVGILNECQQLIDQISDGWRQISNDVKNNDQLQNEH
jgi:flagellar protein FliS